MEKKLDHEARGEARWMTGSGPKQKDLPISGGRPMALRRWSGGWLFSGPLCGISACEYRPSVGWRVE